MKSKIKSIYFGSTFSVISGREEPVILEAGMEKNHKFSEGDQEVGEERTARYISDAYIYHMLADQLKQIPQTDKEERKK